MTVLGETPTLLELRQQSVPHSGVREALLAPMVAPALPDAGRSSSSSFKNQNSTNINRQFFLSRADGDKSAGRGDPALPGVARSSSCVREEEEFRSYRLF
jgi:hypothetical protein